jgi:diacylglycerol O-acyltransferase / wax synthase
LRRRDLAPTAIIRTMASPDRLSRADARLLALETRRGLPLHSGALLILDGAAPSAAELEALVRARLDLLPRHRRRAQALPAGHGRAIWTDDPRFRLAHHLRHASVPGGQGRSALARFASTLLATPVDRGAPLWELWLLDGFADGRFALLSKSHLALVDGITSRDLLSVLLDEHSATAARVEPARGWQPAAPPGSGQLLADAVLARIRDPRENLRGVRALAARAGEELRWRDLAPEGPLHAPPPSRLNRAVGEGRQFAWARISLRRIQRAKDRLGGTVNDAVLTAIAGAIGSYLRDHGDDTDGLLLRALVPLADGACGGLLATSVPLPVAIRDPRRRHAEISRVLDGLRASGRARPANLQRELPGFAASTTLAQAARLACDQRSFNLMIANVPGPQTPRFLLGRELRSVFPAIPLARNQALSVAVISYAGGLGFGLLADPDVVGDVALLADLLEEAVSDLPKRKRKGKSR